MNKNFKLPEKEKYAPKDLFELLAHAFRRPWHIDAAENEEAALEEFNRCREYYSKILEGLNKDLIKAKPVFIGLLPCSRLGPGYVDHHYYSREKGYFYESVFDGMGID